MAEGSRFQDRVTTSSWLLPVVAACCAAIWVLENTNLQVSVWTGLACCALCTYLMAELNNQHLLLRVRSRMVSSTFLVLWTMCGFLHPLQTAHLAVLFQVVCYHAMFGIYQAHESPGLACLIFGCLGCLSLLAPPFLVLVPVFLITLGYFRARSFRVFLGGMMGLLLPFFLAASVCFLTDRLDLLLSYVGHIQQSVPFQYSIFQPMWLIPVALLLVLTVPAMVHFVQTSHQDKVRVRALYFFMLWMEGILFLLLIGFPHLFPTLLLMLMLNSSPLIAHFLTLTHSKYTNAFFLAGLMLIGLITFLLR